MSIKITTVTMRFTHHLALIFRQSIIESILDLSAIVVKLYPMQKSNILISILTDAIIAALNVTGGKIF